MINSFFSPYTELILYKLLYFLAENKDPFKKQIIVVPNSGMERYLQLSIAKHFRISAHIETIYLRQFLLKEYKDLSKNNYQKDLFIDNIEYQKQIKSKRAISFAVLKNLERSSKPNLKNLAKSFKNQKELYSFSKNIAELLFKYTQNRPELVKSWSYDNLFYRSSVDTYEVIQKDIYKNLFDEGFFSLPPDNIEAYNKKEEASGVFTKEEVIHFFGFHFIDEAILSQLSFLINNKEYKKKYNFYVLNPCVNYWLDQKTLTSQLKHKATLIGNKDKDSNIFFNLLGEYGKLGKPLIEYLSDYPFESLFFEENDNLNNNILQKIKSSLVNPDFVSDRLIPDGSIHLEEDCLNDNSLTVNSCSSKLREVQVLKDFICDRLDSDSSLTPSDIIVMVPNIEDYKSEIEGVFSVSKKIPYSIANQSIASEDPLCQNWILLLKLIEDNFPINLLFKFLKQKILKKELMPSDSGIKWLSSYAYKKNIFGGLENEKERQGSIKDLLSILSYENAVLRDSLFTSDQKESYYSLVSLYTILLRTSSWKSLRLSVKEWVNKLKDLTYKIYDADSSPYLFNKLDEWLLEIAKEGVVGDANNSYYLDNYTINFDIFSKDLLGFLEEKELHGPFLSGGISFCTLMPMRAIPKKVIAILGLCDDFPKQRKALPYDLFNKYPEKDDRLPIYEARYLFLEAILSARENLYLSYIGKDDIDHSEKPPSDVLKSLIKYLEYINIPKDNFFREHGYYNFFEKETYNSLFFLKDSYKEKTNKILNNDEAIYKDNSDSSLLTVNRIYSIFKTPLIYYLQKAKKIYLKTSLDNLSVEKPLWLDGLAKYKVEEALKETIYSGIKDIGDDFTKLDYDYKKENISKNQYFLENLRLKGMLTLKEILTHQSINTYYKSNLKAILSSLSHSYKDIFSIDSNNFFINESLITKESFNTLICDEFISDTDDNNILIHLSSSSDTKSQFLFYIKHIIINYSLENKNKKGVNSALLYWNSKKKVSLKKYLGCNKEKTFKEDIKEIMELISYLGKNPVNVDTIIKNGRLYFYTNKYDFPEEISIYNTDKTSDKFLRNALIYHLQEKLNKEQSVLDNTFISRLNEVFKQFDEKYLLYPKPKKK